VVVVPTKYYKTPTKNLADMGVSMVIFANHNLRASVTAMQKTTEKIFKEKSLVGVENEVMHFIYLF
jgi:phosphoenolpyruvate phosphomutase